MAAVNPESSVSVLKVAPKPAKCWEISAKSEISLDLAKSNVLPYSDNIEISGKRVSGIISYEIDKDRKLTMKREIFFPQLHEFKSSEDTSYHDYRAYLQKTHGDDLLPKLYIGDEQFVPGPVISFRIAGTLKISHSASKNGLVLSRNFFPSMDQRMFVEMWTIRNSTATTMAIRSGITSLGFEDYGARGKFSRRVTSDAPASISLEPGKEISFSIQIAAKIEGEDWPEGSAESELGKRTRFLEEMSGSLQLETPSKTLNTLFEFSKIRASESIFESALGLIHSPGGGRYYVGIWANDQAEYVSPFFAYLGYEPGNISAMNCFKAFAKETNPDYKALRYSFEIEGLVPPFPKDRGDAAMIAYGASEYALACGNEATAKKLWPLIEWCLEYCRRNLNCEGVVKSESDEMEGRIETGSANLSTSSLYYGALEQSINLGKSIGIAPEQTMQYTTQMHDMADAIEKYFGAIVEGRKTYKYYKEHKFLRHWICLPLVVGIEYRSKGTIDALFDDLWTDNGVHVEKNSGNKKISNIFWDRGTLYALRGTFIAGATERSLTKLEQFSEKRLLGDRVPYVVEAYPEGGMAHLSAESALYCRIFTEGKFGLKPTGLKSLEIRPRLPKEWPTMSLKHIKAMGEDFDVRVTREGTGLRIDVSRGDKIVKSTTIAEGEALQVSF